MSSPIPAPPPDASTTIRGIVNLAAQSFKGKKTFTDGIGLGAAGITFSDATTQTTAATTPDLSGYETLAHAASTYLAKAGGTMSGAISFGSPAQDPTGHSEIKIRSSNPSVYLEDTGGSGGEAHAGVYFGNPTNAYAWVLAGNPAGNANDAKEFNLADGNANHWSVRATGTSGHDARQYWGSVPLTATSDGHYVFKHKLTQGTGVGNNISTLVIKGADGSTNNQGKVLDIQNGSDVTKASIDLSGNGVFVGTVTGSNLSGTNTGDVTIGTANGLSLASQALSLATAVAGGANGALLGSDKTKLDATSGTNSGDVSLAAVGSSPNANGASLSGQALTLQPADGSNPGLITAGTQTLGGAKTFSGNVTANAITSNSFLALQAFSSLAWAGTSRGLIVSSGTDGMRHNAWGGGSDQPFASHAIFVHDVAPTANSSTTETTASTSSISGSSLNLNGRGLRFRAWGTFATNGNTKTVKVKFGATDLTAGAFATTQNGGAWELEAEVRRTGAATQIGRARWTIATGTQAIQTSSPTETLSGAVTCALTTQGGASNDVLPKYFEIEGIP